MEYYDRARKECMASLTNARSKSMSKSATTTPAATSSPQKPTSGRRRAQNQVLNEEKQSALNSKSRLSRNKSKAKENDDSNATSVPGSQFDLANF